MASIGESFVALVRSIPALTDVLGTSPTRLYPDRRPQNAALPVIAYQLISRPRVMSHDGYSNLATSRYQLTIWAKSADSRSAVSQALLTLLGYKGEIGGIRIDGIFPAGDHDDFEPVKQEFIRYTDIRIVHNEIAEE